MAEKVKKKVTGEVSARRRALSKLLSIDKTENYSGGGKRGTIHGKNKARS